MSEYDPVYQTPHFSNASLMHLQSSSTYSDALHIGLCMLCNSALPPASVPPHMLPPPVCLFVYLCHWCRQGETQSCAPNQPNQIHTTPDTELRRSRTKNPRRTSCIWFNRQPILLQSSPIKLPASHLALNCL